MNRNPNPSRPTRRNWWTRLASLLAILLVVGAASAQTTHIGPANGGNFDLGPSFGANNWSMSSGTNNPWVIGTVPTGAPFAGNSAYPSASNTPGDWSYNTANPCVNYIWRDVTVPVGESVITLSFNWQGQGEASWDLLQVFVAPTSVNPIGQATHPGSGVNNVPASIAGATYVMNTAPGTSGVQTATVSLPPSLAGTTFRLIISWKSDTSLGTQPPVAIDNVSLISNVPTLYTAAVPGGLWNSPASWVGGVVPPGGNDILIPAGSTIVVNQAVSYGNVTVAGKVQWTTAATPSASVNPFTASNLTIDAGGEFLAHGPSGTGTATTGGATVNITGNFINNGFANMAAGGTALWFLPGAGSHTLGGSGTFLADTDGRGMIQSLLCATTANVTISTSQNLVCWNLGNTAGVLTTNNKLHVDNTARANGALIHRSIYTVTVNAHGTGYNSATPPTIGFAAAPAGGTTATAVPNIDDVTGTLRSITITDPGNGYRVAPAVTITGGTGTGATAVAHLYSSYLLNTVSQGQKSGSASVSGGINIPSNQGVYVAVTAGGTGYTSAPNIGVSLPTGFLNIVTNGGSGYTAVPTVTFSGGGALTQATATAVVTRGQVTSINITGGGTGYLSPPTITITGGGGAGATADFPAAYLPTFSANIDATTGMLVSVTTTNPGFGYLAAPTVSLNPATGAGGATVAATLVSRASIYNLINNWFTPSPANVPHTESAFIPTNRRINALTLTNSLGISFTNNLTLYAAAPLPTWTGPINMGGNTLAFDHPTYAGVAGSATNYVENGSISYRFFGNTAAVTRPFPFNSYDGTGAVNYLVNTGAVAPGTVTTDGSTITYVKATLTGAPSGANAAGLRALRLEKNAGALFGNTPSVRMTWNALDNLGAYADQANLFIGQSAALSGPWTVRSVASGAGALAATGNRTTATAAPGPIVSSDEYFAWYTTLAVCTGPPDPANTTGPASACTGANFTLGLSTTYSFLGITYQWQSADDASFSLNLQNLGTGLTQVTNLTSSKYYRCLVTCTTTNDQIISTPLLVNLETAPCNCLAYNLVGIASSTADEEISNVTVGSLNNSSTCVTTAPGAGSILTRYSNYTGFVAAPSFDQGATVPFSLTQTSCGGAYGNGFKLYIDYNQDGDWLDAGEEVFAQPTAATGNQTQTGTFTVPMSATPGITRMRVVNVEATFPNATNYAHTGYSWGETEDYCVNITIPAPCAGTPAPGNTVSSTSIACPNANFNLSLQNPTAGTGVTYQWQSADDAAFTVNLQNLGTASTQTTSQTSAKYYRCLVTCTVSSEATYSNGVFVALGDNCLCGAYCLAANAGGACITNVTLNTLNNTTTCTAPFVSVQTATTTLTQGDSYTFSITTPNDGTYTTSITSVWFDWDNDAVFTPAEWYQPYTSANTGSILITVPGTATLGTIRMRVRSRGVGNQNGAADACLNMGSGETEDYCITIAPAIACDAPPPANTTLSTLSSACVGTNFTLSLQNNVSGSGITYQWQSASDLAFTSGVANLGTGLTQVTSLTGSNLYFRCAIECTNPGGGITYSAPVLVTLVSDACVCGTYNLLGIAGSAADTEMDSVYVGTLVQGVSTCATPAGGVGSIAGMYSNWAGVLPAVSLYQGQTVPFRLRSGTCGGSYGNGFQIYIDYNQDGDWLDAGEQTYSSSVSNAQPNIETGTFIVPGTATLGITRMRVVNVEGGTWTNNYAHTGFTWGETEDFCVNITPPPVGASATGTINDNCIAGTYTIGVNVTSFGSGSSADIVYSVNNGTPVTVSNVSLGTTTIPTSGSFSQLDIVSITVTNGTITALNMGNFYGNCPIVVECGTVLPVSHCYGNFDPRVFVFITDDPFQLMRIRFLSGTMDPNDVIRTYAGTDENNSPPLVSGTFADLGSPQLTIESVNDTIMLIIDSDGSNSCQSGGQTTWNFEASCVPPCVEPDGSVTYDLCTQMITVNLDFEGSGATAGIRYIVNNGTPVDITGLTAPATQQIGPFTPGQSVQVFLLHEDDSSCNRNMGTTNIVAPAGQPTLVASASPTTICAGGSSTLSAVASGGVGPVATYVFQTATGGTMADMTGATQLLAPGLDDSASPSTAMGFTFPYGVATYTNFFVSSNGQMNLGGAAGNASLGNDLANSTPRPVLTCWWDDLHTGSDGYVQTKLFGSPGSYIRVVEWKVRDYPGAGLATTMLMQIWLYQSGMVELRYGPSTGVSDGGASIGITGTGAGQFQSVTSPAHTVSTVTENISNSVWPGDGRIYRWLLPEVTGTTYTWNPGNLSGGTVVATGITQTTNFTVVATVPGGCPETTNVLVTVNDPLTSAAITPNPASFCTGGSVLLTATAANGVPPFTYQWTGPGGPAGTAQTQSANAAGTWTCLVTDACSGSFLASVNVGSTTTPVVNITASAPICVGGSVTFTANVVSGNVTTWLWGGAAPVGGQTGNTVTINSLTAGNNGTYTLVGSDAGCNSAPASYVLSVNPAPTVTTTTATPNPVCEGSNSVLNVSASLPTSAYCAPGYSTGCIFPDIISDVNFAGIARSSGCDALNGIGYSVFTSPSGAVTAGSTYPMSVTTDGDVEGVAVWIDYNRNGTFEASELVLSSAPGGPPFTHSGNVTIPLTAFNGTTRVRFRCNYNATPAADGACTAVTYGETEDYNITISGGATQLSYLWSGGPFLGGVNNTQSVTATGITTNPTPYSVLVTAGTGCTNTGNVSVNVTPLPTVSCGGPYPTLCVAAAPFQLTGSPSGGTWSGTGVTSGGLFNPASGTQLLTYTVTQSGCSNSCTVTVNVNSTDTDGDNIPDCVDQCPSIAGQIGDACVPGPGFILGTIDANCNCVGVACSEDVRLQVRTDNNGFHTSFQIRESFTDLLVCSGGPFTGINNAEITQDCCLPEGCYNLLVFDSAGDGIVGGGYVLREANGNQRRIIDNARDAYGNGGLPSGILVSQIDASPGFCVPMGTDRLIATSCDKLDWVANQCANSYIVANDNAAVTAAYPDANSGYQFWFYNPNGGYSFRRFRSHTVGEGFTPGAGIAYRAAHCKLNNWAVGNHLQGGVLYNVKVRARVNGEDAAWGPACRMMLDADLAQCKRTKLLDTPSSQYLSCGSSRTISSNSLVHAVQVKRLTSNSPCTWQNANRYQFRFRLPAENVVIIKTSNTGQYWVNTTGLACGKTYEVDVRASFDNGANWCVVTPNPNSVSDPQWGDICLLTTTCNLGMAQEGNGTTGSTAELAMYPNPNRGDQLMLSLSSVEEGVEKVTVEIYDAYGKRAIARTIPVQDGFLNTVVELNEQLANGLYMVSITAGTKAYNERLVIQK